MANFTGLTLATYLISEINVSGVISTTFLTDNGRSAIITGMTHIDADTKREIIKALRAEDHGIVRKDQAEALAEMLENSGEELHPALKPWVFDSFLGPMVKHPFVYIDIAGGFFTKNANKMYEWKRRVRRDYINNRNWKGFIFAHERPWRMIALEKLWMRQRITLDELREILPVIWVDTEMPEGNQAEPMFLFREAGFVTDDPEGWEKLPEEFQVFRGVDGEYELTPSGPSWTTDIQVARTFAYRYGAKGTVYRYIAKKSEALAWFADRHESEIILDFGGDSDLEQIEVEESREET